MSQKEYLLAFIQGDAGLDWSRNRYGWDEETDECDWDGVKCDKRGQITAIDIQGSHLLATIPPELSKITSLTHLYVGSNKLYGTVPREISSLPNLVQIDLSLNNLSGVVPLMKSSSKTLEVMNFAYNQFYGTLPRKISRNMHRLTILDVNHNRLSGNIPMELGNLWPLVQLELSDNLFSGPIPESLGSLSNLEGLFLSNNYLTGSIPYSLTRDHLKLNEIFLHNNRLSGTIPVALANLPYLNIIFLDDNKLTGTVPNELCNLNLNKAFFYDHPHLEATPPNDNTTYRELDPEGRRRKRRLATDPTVVRDGCNSIACPTGYHSSQSKGKDGVFPCIECEPNSLNPYVGASKCFELDQNKILQIFYNGTDGPNWKTQNDTTWSDESVPVCEKMGITCNHGGDIIAIELSSMGLVGTIADDIGFLRHLEVLNLSNNQLSGQIPSDLRFAPLERFDLSGNLLTGVVPDVLCQKRGINRNGKNGELSCDAITCAAGSFNELGRAETENGHVQCKHCPSNQYLGSKECAFGPFSATIFFSSDGYMNGMRISLLLIGVCMGTGLLLLCFKVRRTVSEKQTENDESPLNDDSDGEDIMSLDSRVALSSFSVPSPDVFLHSTLKTIDDSSQSVYSRGSDVESVKWKNARDSLDFLDVPRK